MCWVQGGMIQTLMLALEEHAPFGMRNRWVTNHSPQWQELQYVHTVLKRKKMGQLPSREWGWGNIREGFLEMVKSESWRINLQERLIHALKSILLKTNKTKSCDHALTWTIIIYATLVANSPDYGQIHFQSKDQKEQSIQRNTQQNVLWC